MGKRILLKQLARKNFDLPFNINLLYWNEKVHVAAFVLLKGNYSSLEKLVLNWNSTHVKLNIHNKNVR